MNPNTSDISRDACMLVKDFARRGYDWWWHSFTAEDAQTGITKPFFIEFFLCNPDLAKDEPTFGLAEDGTRPADVEHCPSYLMVKVGTWGNDKCQLHRFFPWKDVEVGSGVPFYVQADDCLCCETDLIGRVEVTPEDAAAHPEWMSDAGSMLFDLHLDKRMAFNVGYGANDKMRGAQAFDMFWHAEGIKTLVSGTVVFNGRRYVVVPETSYGYSDKNWGRDFTTPWVWLSSWDLVSNVTGERLENSVFEIGGGRPVVFGHALDRKLLGCMLYEGEEFEFNFSKPWTGSQTSFECYETDTEIIWHVDQETFGARLITDIRCPKVDMLLMNYESPDGKKRFSKLWNGGNGHGRIQLYRKQEATWELVDDIAVNRAGCEYGEYDPE